MVSTHTGATGDRFHVPTRRPQKGSAHDALFFGGSFVLVGVVFLFDHLGYLGGRSVWDFWPLLLIWGGVLDVIDPRTPSSRVWGLALLAAGALFLASNLGLRIVGLGAIWPLALIVLGLYLVVRTLGRQGTATAAPLVTDEHTLYRKVLFSGRDERITSRTFRGGVLVCKAGGMELDLTAAEMEGDEATLQLDITMGGIELHVPRHWQVISDVSPVMGGLDDRTQFSDAQGPAKRLRLTGRVFLGGVEIGN